MGLLDRVRRRIQEAAPPPKLDYKEQLPLGSPAEVDPLSDKQRNVAADVIAASLRTPSERERAERYADFKQMDSADIAAMLDSVTNAALTFDDARAEQGFKVECEDTRANDILQRTLKRTGIQDKIFAYGRELLKYGDVFVEPLYSGKDLVGVQSYDPSEIIRNQDDKGRLVRGKEDGMYAAFQQRKQGKIIAGWQPWEMVHFKLFPSDRFAYSTKGMLDPVRGDWAKLEAVKEGLVVARLTRAYPRRIHTLDQTNRNPNEQREMLSAYMARMTRKQFDKRPVNQKTGLPTADVAEDLFISTGYIQTPNGDLVPRRNDVRTEDPAMAGLAELKDVEFLRQSLWAVVPIDTVGIRRNTTGDLDSQDLAYARFLRRFQNQMAIGIRQLLNQQLLAYGMLDVEFKIVFPVVIVGAAWKHADARFKDSLTLRNYLEMGAISRRFAIKRSFGLSDAEVDVLFDSILEEAQSPVFTPVLPFRNGQPTNLATTPDLKAANTPATDVGGAKAKAHKDSLPTAATGPAALLKTLDPEKAKAITNSGVWRGTPGSKRLAGFNSA